MKLFNKKGNKKVESSQKEHTRSIKENKLNVLSLVREIVGGDVFLREIFQKQLLLILLLFTLSLAYINNRFLYEKELRELQSKREELDDLKKRSVTVLKDLKRTGRRSFILEELSIQGSDLIENDEPVIVID